MPWQVVAAIRPGKRSVGGRPAKRNAGSFVSIAFDTAVVRARSVWLRETRTAREKDERHSRGDGPGEEFLDYDNYGRTGTFSFVPTLEARSFIFFLLLFSPSPFVRIKITTTVPRRRTETRFHCSRSVRRPTIIIRAFACARVRVHGTNAVYDAGIRRPLQNLPGRR